MKKTLADFNFFYSLFLPVTGFGVRCHYRNIVIKGQKNIPEGEHYIIAPCHQNALMDPMLILQMTRKATVFLARADIFKKPVANFFLTWLRISPVYRIRDGRDQLSKNEEVFNNAQAALETGAPLCLMAEGRHNDKHQLLPLVKGMFRIAASTQQKLGAKPLYILPVGIDYDDYEDLYSNACLNIGKPIDIRTFMDEYANSEAVALNHMRDALTASLKEQMHHVGSQERYADEYAYCHKKTQDTIRDLDLRNNAWSRFMARQHVSQQLAQMDEADRAPLLDVGAQYAKMCDTKKVPLWFASKGWTKNDSRNAIIKIAAILLLFLIPTVFQPKYWILSNLIVFLPTHLFGKYKIKDPQFRSSVNYGIRLLLTFLYIVVIFIVFTCKSGIAAGLGMVLLGILSAYYTPRLFVHMRDLYYAYRMKTEH